MCRSKYSHTDFYYVNLHCDREERAGGNLLIASTVAVDRLLRSAPPGVGTLLAMTGELIVIPGSLPHHHHLLLSDRFFFCLPFRYL
ncbi:MAG: hypothetical protein KJ607_02620 [Bacteroidetes bacterium]|nr:hypothetical protein [Bacteroidota bacterium]